MWNEMSHEKVQEPGGAPVSQDQGTKEGHVSPVDSPVGTDTHSVALAHQHCEAGVSSHTELDVKPRYLFLAV